VTCHRPRRRTWSARAACAPLLLAAALASTAGCRERDGRPPADERRNPDAEQFRQTDMVKNSFRVILDYEQYADEMLPQAVNRLDEWARDQKPLPDWRLDPMVARLRPEIIEGLGLDRLEFPKSDGFVLREAVWLRDVSTWARGDAVDDLQLAAALFDWTVRNIQLDWAPGTRGPQRPTQKPWETLLLGHGTGDERAAVFILMARQQRLDAALIAVPQSGDDAQKKVRPWAVGVLIDGEIFLFDPNLGLPIPAPQGIRRDAAGGLRLRPATLREVVDDAGLLRRLHVGDEFRYPFDEVRDVAVLLEASPSFVAQRMKLLESQLTGDETLVLTTEPSKQAERFRACAHVADVDIWPMPYQIIAEESMLGPKRAQWQKAQLTPFLLGLSRIAVLWKARQYHFKGIFEGDETATTFYQQARPPDKQLERADLNPALKAALIQGKMDASYWLGLIAVHLGNETAAVDWLATRTIAYTPPPGPWPPNSPWVPGAKYNLGRLYESKGDVAEAVAKYRSDADSPARHGNLLRARWLESGVLSTPTEQPTAKPAAGQGHGESAPEAPSDPVEKPAEEPAADVPPDDPPPDRAVESPP